jgi:hypothetical protein
MQKNDQTIILVLQLIKFRSHPLGFKIFPVFFLQKGHLEITDLNLLEIDWVLTQLKSKNYIQKINKNTFQKHLDKLEEFALLFIKELKKILKATDQEIEKVLKENLLSKGIRMKDGDTEKYQNFLEHPDMKKNLTDEFDEDFGKSKIIGRFAILGDLEKLEMDIANGRSFKDIEVNFVDLYYKHITKTLYILDEKPIVISRYKSTEIQHHKLIKEIFKQGKEKKYIFESFVKEGVMNKNITSDDYRVMCKEIQEKIAKSTENRVIDFLVYSSHSVQINPKYVKKLPQVTLQIT